MSDPHLSVPPEPSSTDDGQDLPAPVCCLSTTLVTAAGMPESRAVEAMIAAEVPVALVFNGISHAVMMATPADLREFALGFALSEGIIASPKECYGMEVSSVATCTTSGNAPLVVEMPACEVRLEIAARRFVALKERRRSLVGRTGCGVCGIDNLEALDIEPESVVSPGWVRHLDAATVLRAVSGLSARQPLNELAHAVHAAGWARPDGSLVRVMEDVGRHNALDKLLGWRAAAGPEAREGFVVMTSRASYELARKCARLGVPVLATVSAPTGLAIAIARQAGMQLYGLCRGDTAVRYVPA